jgi:hypothetical protein
MFNQPFLDFIISPLKYPEDLCRVMTAQDVGKGNDARFGKG